MILLPKDNFIIRSFFRTYMQYSIEKSFHQIVHTPLNETDYSLHSLLILSNHHSWWDGFVLYYCNRHIFKKKFHLLMSAQNYTKHHWFKYLGAIGIPNENRKKITAIEYCKKILTQTENALFLFPQGKLYSQHIDTFQLQKGWKKLIDSTQKIVFVHQFTDYFENRKPTLYLYTDIYNPKIPLEEAYVKSFEAAKNKQKQICV